jgi:hypothetical protein
VLIRIGQGVGNALAMVQRAMIGAIVDNIAASSEPITLWHSD